MRNNLVFNIVVLFFVLLNFVDAEIEITELENATIIPNQYIVTLKRRYRRNLETHIDSILEIFSGKSKLLASLPTLGLGFTARMTSETLAKVQALDVVESIEPDTIVKLSNIQKSAPWGLARITSKSKPSFLTNSRYIYESDGGEGVTAYIIDSGIDIEHNDFEGRAKWGKTMISNAPSIDENGHGTHVAGIIGGKTYGVAKAVDLVAVKVFDKSGSSANSDIIAAIEWVITQKSKSKKGNVINMSFGSSYSPALNKAAETAVEAGFVVVAAAGNFNKDACLYSPASAKGIITVGATTISDYVADFSNYGKCMDIFAPGERIISTWPDDETKSLSGTSMASPHIAGLAAIILGKGKLDTPKRVKDFIIESSTKNTVKGATASTPNRLEYYEGS